jgi:hypothetical protein
MAFKMKGHTLPGPYQKVTVKAKQRQKGSATGTETKTSYSEEDVKTAKKDIQSFGEGYDVKQGDVDYLKDRWKKNMTSDYSKTSSGQKETMSSMSGGKMPTKTVTKVTRAKDEKSLKRPLKKKGDPKKGPGGDVNVLLRDLKNYKTGKPGKAMTKSVKKKNKS